MFVGYWNKRGLDIYRLAKGKVERFASGSPEQLKPVKSLGKIVLIVGRELLLHTRKKYPPASADDLKKAVGLEIGGMFPLKSPSFFLSVSGRTEAYTLADIWAWDSSEYENLRGVFPFTHVLPEDMAFISGEPEISVMGGASAGTGISYLLAHSREGFLGVSSFRGRVSRSHVEMLLKAISRHAEDFRRLNLCGGAEVGPDMYDAGFALVKKESLGYPACIENLSGLDLKQFSVRTEPVVLEYIGIGLRSVIYLLFAYGLCLTLAGMHYDDASNEVKIKTAKLGAGMSVIVSGKEKDYSKAAGELKEKLKNWSSPIEVMDLLAKNLPGKSYVTRLLLNEKTLELTAASNDALAVVEAMGKAEGVESVKLKGSPAKNDKAINPFYLTVELK